MNPNLMDLPQMGFSEDLIDELNVWITDPLAYVREFKEVTGQEADSHLYLNLINEEIEEWAEAETDIEELKELADVLYVIYGYALAKGWDITEALSRVHYNNLGRVIQEDGTIHRRADGKIIKNPKAPKIDLEDLL